MLPPVAVAIGFIDCINCGDLDRLDELMSDDHRLEVLDETPVEGRDANLDAWDDYFTSFPNYVIYPHRFVEADGIVAVLGHTTGSHLELPDEEEARLTLIWAVHVQEGVVTRWRILEDTFDNRRHFNFAD